MGARQARQRPRSSSQPATGTLSRQATGVPQAGQRDPGRTSDSRRGTRWMTTLANDPAARPRRPASEAAASGVMAGKPTCPRPVGERFVNIRRVWLKRRRPGSRKHHGSNRPGRSDRPCLAGGGRVRPGPGRRRVCARPGQAHGGRPLPCRDPDGRLALVVATSRDLWVAVSGARYVASGALGFVYESSPALTALPLYPILLAPLVAAGDALGLSGSAAPTQSRSATRTGATPRRRPRPGRPGSGPGSTRPARPPPGSWMTSRSDSRAGKPAPPIGYRGGARLAWNSTASRSRAPASQSRNGAAVTARGRASAPAARRTADRSRPPRHARPATQARKTRAKGASRSLTESAARGRRRPAPAGADAGPRRIRPGRPGAGRRSPPTTGTAGTAGCPAGTGAPGGRPVRAGSIGPGRPRRRRRPAGTASGRRASARGPGRWPRTGPGAGRSREMMSGSWRRTCLRALANDLVSSADLALVDQAALVGVEELDRVLDGHDVVVALPVGQVDQAGQGGRLARAGGPGDQHEPPGRAGEAAHLAGDAECLQRLDLLGDEPEDGPHRVALEGEVEPEPGLARQGVVAVQLLLALQLAQASVDPHGRPGPAVRCRSEAPSSSTCSSSSATSEEPPGQVPR